MSTNNFTIEEMEDQAVKKSNIAKGIGITAAAAVVSTGTAYAATTMLSDQPAEEGMTADDVTAGMSNAVQTENTVYEHTNYGQPVLHTTTHHTEVHHVNVSKPTTTGTGTNGTETETEMITEESVGYYIVDEDGVTEVKREEVGTIGGVDYKLEDHDGDGYANVVYYDKNRNNQFEDNERVEVTTKDGIRMTDPDQAKHATDVVIVAPEPTDPQPPVWEPKEKEYYVQNEEEKSDIKNDFDPSEKEDELYAGDFADHNEDYQHNEDVEDYYA